MKCFRSRLTRDGQTGSRYMIVSEIDHMISLIIFQQQTKFQTIPISRSLKIYYIFYPKVEIVDRHN